MSQMCTCWQLSRGFFSLFFFCKQRDQRGWHGVASAHAAAVWAGHRRAEQDDTSQWRLPEM